MLQLIETICYEDGGFHRIQLHEERMNTSFSNVVFLKDGKWYTPTFPLLHGTRRTDYLQMKNIFPKVIRSTELHLFEEVRLINAMNLLEDGNSISIDNIFW